MLIDTDDLEKVKKAGSWGVYRSETNKSFYALGKIKNNQGKWTTIYMHRYIMGAKKPSEIIDHVFHNTLDNRKKFLRSVNHSKNAQNSTIRSDSTSGVTGVNWNKRQNKWIARISAEGINYNLGYFATLEEAKQARLEAEKKYHSYNQMILQQCGI